MEEEDFKQIIQLRKELDKNNSEEEKQIRTGKKNMTKIKIDGDNIIPTKIYKNLMINTYLSNKWQYEKIIFSTKANEQDKRPQISSWVENNKKDKLAFFSKFAISLIMPKYDDEEYNNYLTDPNWSREETDSLMELMETFEGNFLIVRDRGDFGNKSLEDIKDRLFTVCKTLDEIRNVPNSKYKDIVYNKELEKVRKIKSERYLTRPAEKFEIEEKLLNDLKNLEILIKKKERENRNFKKLIEYSKTEKIELEGKKIDLEDIDDAQILKNISGTPYAFNRGGIMKGPIVALPAVTNKKLELALNQMEQPTNTIATKNNMEKFDLLRKLLLQLFSLKYFYDKKKDELDKLKINLKPDLEEPEITPDEDENLKKNKKE